VRLAKLKIISTQRVNSLPHHLY